MMVSSTRSAPPDGALTLTAHPDVSAAGYGPLRHGNIEITEPVDEEDVNGGHPARMSALRKEPR